MKSFALCSIAMILTLGFPAAAQNFRPVPVQTQAQYVSFDDQRIIKFLTATPPTLTDSVVHMRPNWYHGREMGSNILKLVPTTSTLLGDSLRLKPDGKYTSKIANTYWFEWDFRPSISSFVIYSDSNLLIQANLTQTDNMLLFGNATTVRKYTIIHNVQGWFGPISLWISEDYGVIRSNAVFLQPYMVPNIVYWWPRTISLEGIRIGNTDLGFADPPTVVSHQAGEVLVYLNESYRADPSPATTQHYTRYTLLQPIDTIPGFERWLVLQQDYSADYLTLTSSDTNILRLDRFNYDDIGLQTLYRTGSAVSGVVYFRKQYLSSGALELERFGIYDSIIEVGNVPDLRVCLSMSRIASDLGMTYAISRSFRRNSCINYDSKQLVYSFVNGQHTGQEPNFAATSISELKLNQNQFQVYPSPFDAYLKVQSSYQGKLNYRISALNGQSLQEATLHLEGESATIQTSEFLPGMYLLYLWLDGQEAKPFKLVKY